VASLGSASPSSRTRASLSILVPTRGLRPMTKNAERNVHSTDTNPQVDVAERPEEKGLSLKQLLEKHWLTTIVGIVLATAFTSLKVFDYLNGPAEEELRRYRQLNASPEQIKGMLAGAGKMEFAECGLRVVTIPWDAIDSRRTEVFECGATKFTISLETYRPLVGVGEPANTDGKARLHVFGESKGGKTKFECLYFAYPKDNAYTPAGNCPFISGPLTLDRSPLAPNALRITGNFLKLEP